MKITDYGDAIEFKSEDMHLMTGELGRERFFKNLKEESESMLHNLYNELCNTLSEMTPEELDQLNKDLIKTLYEKN